jgi:hypothetical protein
VFIVAVTLIAAVVATTAAVLSAPSLLGRPLAGVELALVGIAAALIAYGLATSRRRRLRKQILGMRDSALW